MNRETWKLEFDKNKCVVCELCIDACPLGGRRGSPQGGLYPRWALVGRTGVPTGLWLLGHDRTIIEPGVAREPERTRCQRRRFRISTPSSE